MGPPEGELPSNIALSSSTINFLNIRTPKKLVITLKFEQDGFIKE